jgi:thioredoxin-like negative regulator of GroEL
MEHALAETVEHFKFSSRQAGVAYELRQKGKSIMKEVNAAGFKSAVLESTVPVVVVIWGVG